MKSIPYLKACLKESFRLNPAALRTGRILDSEITVSGYKIPPKVLVMVTGVPYCRDPEYFPDPMAYNPDRWINQDNEFPNQNYLLQQFGFGPRMCLGVF
uniref:Cytochrome P450 n=1 Tax=Arcella intermedia TaxID=1963864 RepID=A0A6B2LSL0_9EUKA